MMVRVKALKTFGGNVVDEYWLLVNPRHVTTMDCANCSAFIIGVGWLKLGKGSFKRLRRAVP